MAAALAAARAARRLASTLSVLALALRAVLALAVRRGADAAAEGLRLREAVDLTGAFVFLVIVPDPFLLAFLRAAMTEKLQTR